MARATVAARQPQRFVELIPFGTQIDFVGLRGYALTISGLLIAASIGLWFARGGPNYGIDFAGGTMLHLRFSKVRTASEVRGLLKQAGVGAAELQDLGGGVGEFLVRLPGDATGETDVAGEIVTALRGTSGDDAFEVLRTEMVGPKVGKDLRQKALLAILASTIMMGIYLTVRFQLRFGIGAAVALAHDVIVTLGALLLFNFEFNLPVVAALLTVIGFSVNDTVIVSDRIRENRGKMRRENLATIANRSINETLSRTVITTGTSLFVTAALFALGGSVIHGFAFTLLVGFTVGTYSSIFVATPVVLMFDEPSAGRR